MNSSYSGNTVTPYHEYPASVGARPRRSAAAPSRATTALAPASSDRPSPNAAGSVCCIVFTTSSGTTAACVIAHPAAPASANSAYVSGGSATSFRGRDEYSE